jgi:glyoxylase-like metal-dependent hydrolase (beta-lactamase superfamily II)
MRRSGFVINTHWHPDHTSGNEPMTGAGALIFAHENVRKRMSAEQFSKFMNRTIPASPAAALPVVTFSDGVTLHWNGETIRVEHVAPAHTDGDSQVWFEKANAVHMGDTFVNGFFPFIDVESGGRVDGLIDSAEPRARAHEERHADHPGPRPAREARRPREVPRHARRREGPRPEGDQVGQEDGAIRRVEAARRSRRRVGRRLHQDRSVRHARVDEPVREVIS